MASEVDISNLALSHLGDEATVVSLSPPEGSAQAQHCARYYPLARDMLLEQHAWGFATRTEALAQIDYTVDGYDYAYAEPSGCLKPVKLYASGGRREQGAEFERETDSTGQQIILANIEDPWLQFVARTTDTTKFTPLFVDALSWLEASMIAGPLIKGEAGIKAGRECWQVFVNRFGVATAADANKSTVRLSIDPAWIAGR